jgi:hypothetical protein
MKEQEPYERKRNNTMKIMIAIFVVAVIFGIIYTYGSFPYKKSEVLPASRPATEESQRDYSTVTTQAGQ